MFVGNDGFFLIYRLFWVFIDKCAHSIGNPSGGIHRYPLVTFVLRWVEWCCILVAHVFVFGFIQDSHWSADHRPSDWTYYRQWKSRLRSKISTLETRINRVPIVSAPIRVHTSIIVAVVVARLRIESCIQTKTCWLGFHVANVNLIKSIRNLLFDLHLRL